MTPLAIGLGLAGLAWGVVADRISARWPAHLPGGPDGDEADAGFDDETAATEASTPHAGHSAGALPIRGVDWRTVVVAAVGGIGLFLVPGRFDAPLQQAIFGGWVVVLTLMLATDLDQRLLPDVLTLPLIPISLVIALAGANPFISGGLTWPLIAAFGFPLGFWLLSIPFGTGAIGVGDLKLLVSVGLTLGFLRTFTGLALGALLSGVVVIVLLGARVIGRRSYIPYGPFLIIGTLWSALISN